MATLYEELVENLKEQYEYYNELLEISTEKTNVIVNNDTESLTKINTVENMLVGRLEKLDKKNREILDDIVMVTGKKLDKVSVKTVATLLSDEESKELDTLTKELVDVATKMKLINDKNKILVSTSLEYTEVSMNVFRQMHDNGVDVTYENELKRKNN